jgi:MFS family permease
VSPSLDRLPRSFRALRHRNFRLFLAGQVVSLIGTWMQQLALGWLVYRMTRSPFLLGLVGFAGQAPSLVLSPVAGVLADRWNQRHMVLVTQSLSLLQAAALSILVLTGRVDVWHVVVLSLFLGLVNAVDTPVRQAFLVQMVGGREDLANAIALNSTTFNAARLVGPAIGGALIARLGEGLVFLLNALSYIAVIAALLAMKAPPAPAPPPGDAALWSNLREGVRYVAGFAPIRSILLLAGLVSLAGTPYTVLMPVFATDVLHGDAHTLGFLMGAVGIGALAGALTLAARKSVRGLGLVIVAAVTTFGAGLVAFSASRVLWVSLVLLLGCGWGLMVQMASCNTILQTIVDDDKRGRVMSFYAVAVMGTLPIGSLLAGALAARIGAPRTVAVGGATCLVAALAFARSLPALRAQIRPIYARLGILPAVAAGLETATEPAAASAAAGAARGRSAG